MTPPRVLIPLVRRVLPGVIAQDILGVQPMTGPVGSIFTLRSRYRYGLVQPRRYPVAPGIYRHFLRINNRRRTQNDADLDAAGYASVTLPWRNSLLDDEGAPGPINEWCDAQLGRHAWLHFPHGRTWWFSRDDDAVLFRMVWCDVAAPVG